MASELFAEWDSGLVLYAVAADRATGEYLAGATPGAFDPLAWGTYAIPLAESGTSGRYFGDMPAAPAGSYRYLVYQQSGAAPAPADAAVYAPDGPLEWGGAAVVPLASRSTYAGGAVASVTAPVTVGTVNDKAGYSLATPPPTAAEIRADLDANSARLANLDDTITSRLAATAYVAPPTVAAIRADLDANSTRLANLDVAVGSRFAAADYDVPPTAADVAAAAATATAAAILVTPANKLATDAAGRVTADVAIDKAGYTLAADGLDAVTVEPGVNARQALAPILAACAGVVSGAGTGTVKIQAGANAGTTRITAQTDTQGNRSSVTLALPS